MPNHDTIGRELLRRRECIGTKQPLKSVQLTFAFKYQPNDCALRRKLIGLHRC